MGGARREPYGEEGIIRRLHRSGGRSMPAVLVGWLDVSQTISITRLSWKHVEFTIFRSGPEEDIRHAHGRDVDPV